MIILKSLFFRRVVQQLPMLWFIWAQGAKRCHDVGKNGWYQIIPFYFLGMIFIEGDSFWNSYGENPKGATMSKSTSESAIKLGSEQLSNRPAFVGETTKNHTTTMQVKNVNYSNLNEILLQLRKIPFVKTLNNTLLDATATIIITHDYDSQYLSNEFIKTIDRVTVVAVSEGSIIIKIK